VIALAIGYHNFTEEKRMVKVSVLPPEKAVFNQPSLPAVSPDAQLTWFDRAGRAAGTVGAPGILDWPAISPDGSTVAFERLDQQTGVFDVWMRDLARGTESRFTFNSQNNRYPVWSPDGGHVAFNSTRNGLGDVYQKAASGNAKEEILDKDLRQKLSPNGQKMMAAEVKNSGGQSSQAKFEASVPKPFFEVRIAGTGVNPTAFWFDVGKDGRFLIPTVAEQTASVPLTVVINWTAGLKK
jgi:hypothetical protein